MKKQYLLDANDAFKKMVFGWLLPDLPRLHVIPMITDPPSAWTTADWNLYAQLFGIPTSSVLAQQCQFTNNRLSCIHGYFSALLKANSSILCAGADFFVDPDTGLTDKGGGADYINAAEVAALLKGSNDRVVIIYQHSNRDTANIGTNLQNHRSNIQNAVQQNNPQPNNQPLHTFGICGTSICLFFFSLNGTRLNNLKNICLQRFGPTSSRVI